MRIPIPVVLILAVASAAHAQEDVYSHEIRPLGHPTLETDRGNVVAKDTVPVGFIDDKTILVRASRSSLQGDYHTFSYSLETGEYQYLFHGFSDYVSSEGRIFSSAAEIGDYYFWSPTQDSSKGKLTVLTTPFTWTSQETDSFQFTEDFFIVKAHNGEYWRIVDGGEVSNQSIHRSNGGKIDIGESYYAVTTIRDSFSLDARYEVDLYGYDSKLRSSLVIAPEWRERTNLATPKVIISQGHVVLLHTGHESTQMLTVWNYEKNRNYTTEGLSLLTELLDVSPEGDVLAGRGIFADGVKLYSEREVKAMSELAEFVDKPDVRFTRMRNGMILGYGNVRDGGLILLPNFAAQPFIMIPKARPVSTPSINSLLRLEWPMIRFSQESNLGSRCELQGSSNLKDWDTVKVFETTNGSLTFDYDVRVGSKASYLRLVLP